MAMRLSLVSTILFALFVLAACGGAATEEPPVEYYIPATSAYLQTSAEETEQALLTESDEPELDAIPSPPEDFIQGDIDNLPVWLRTGLEMYLLGTDTSVISFGTGIAHRMASDELPDFGDAWFIPGFIPDAQPEEAEAVALAFVQHISNIGALQDFVEQHSDIRQTEEAEAVAAYFWSDFTGAAKNEGFSIRYEQGRVQRVDGSPSSPFGITLSVRGNYALYHFGHEADNTPEPWTKDMVNHHIAIAEESIRFVSDWLSHEPDSRFDVFFIHVDRYGGGGYGNGMITNFQHILDPPWAMAHEAVHGILSAAQIQNNFPQVRTPIPGGFMTIPFFEEGMCIMLELLFEIATENERFALEAAGRRRGYATFSGEFGNQETRLTLEDALQYVNNIAIGSLNHLYEPGNTERFGTRYTVLNMHHTAASFMFYLYAERGTREDLILAYQDIYLMYEIYGADMEGMIQSWLEWLNDWR